SQVRGGLTHIQQARCYLHMGYPLSSISTRKKRCKLASTYLSSGMAQVPATARTPMAKRCARSRGETCASCAPCTRSPSRSGGGGESAVERLKQPACRRRGGRPELGNALAAAD